MAGSSSVMEGGGFKDGIIFDGRTVGLADFVNDSK